MLTAPVGRLDVGEGIAYLGEMVPVIKIVRSDYALSLSPLVEVPNRNDGGTGDDGEEKGETKSLGAEQHC